MSRTAVGSSEDAEERSNRTGEVMLMLSYHLPGAERMETRFVLSPGMLRFQIRKALMTHRERQEHYGGIV